MLSRCSATGLVEGWRDRGEWGVSRLAHLWGGVGDGAPIPACVSTRAGGTVYIIFFVQVSVALRCVCVCAGVCVCVLTVRVQLASLLSREISQMSSELDSGGRG